jgi:PhnB protein
MTTVNLYLNFKGNCEEAFNLYKSAFGGEFADINRFKEMPPDENFPIPTELGEKIMHISYPISKETMLMGSDVIGKHTESFIQGNNFAVSINTQSTQEADRLFQILSEGGTITMPLSQTFWGAYFGMFTDKFGINWMINVDLNK